MPRSKYLLRLDDACETMDQDRWGRLESILDRHGICPMVGVIPANKDMDQAINPPDPAFWEKVKKWESQGWAIALHGYDHCCITKKPGINPLWPRSEFAGVSLDQQKVKIREGVRIFRGHGINPRFFFAPSHTFDLNTLEALRTESDIRIISDTIATMPYRWRGFSFVPQMGGRCREMKIPGIWTICLHPSAMSDKDLSELEMFASRHADEFMSFDDIDYSGLQSKNLVGRFLSSAYFINRKLSRIRHRVSSYINDILVSHQK